ncbi:Fur family transcriptional regulator [Allofustis seminis]|uniref:Fur family transcriptional regulator n=1 Tax=Allofustis seminis TaxID=166939 RepID=UPI00036F8282|nr:Fur family transcriptional regulator [Allofustis seminis]
MTLISGAIETLRGAGYKITDRRIAMLEVLYGTDKHLTAKDVTERMAPDFPEISPDTIYRNLHTFFELGILEETEYEAEKYFMVKKAPHDHHHHFICTNCGKFINIKMCPLNYFEEQLGDVKISGHRFELYGLCADCKKKLETQSED